MKRNGHGKGNWGTQLDGTHIHDPSDIDARDDMSSIVDETSKISFKSDAYVVFKLMEAIINLNVEQYEVYVTQYQQKRSDTNHFFEIGGQYGAIIDKDVYGDLTQDDWTSLDARKEHFYFGTNQDSVTITTPAQVWEARASGSEHLWSA